MQKLLFFLITILIALAPTMASCRAPGTPQGPQPGQASPQPTASPSPLPPPLPGIVKIGVIYPITGRLVDVNHWGDEAEPLWQQAGKDINNLDDTVKQGVQFKLVIRSSDSTGAGALKAAQDLVENEGVQAIVGLPTGSEASATVAYLTKNQIAAISSGSTGPKEELRQPDTLYRIMPNEIYLAHKMARLAMELGYTRAAIIYRTDGWGDIYAEEFASRFTAQGYPTASVAIEPTHPNVKDYETEVAELSQKVAGLGVDPHTAVVMAVWEGEDLNILHHAAADRNLSSVRWFSAAAGPALLYGVFDGGPSLPDASKFAYTHGLWSYENHSPLTPSVSNLLKYAEKELGRKPHFEHVYLYDAIQLMARAILLAGTYDGVSIASHIPGAAGVYDAATGPIHFDINGDRDAGDMAYTCMLPAGGDYEYQYCAYFRDDASGGYFEILKAPELRDRTFCVEC